jgi:hypothetical protein
MRAIVQLLLVLFSLGATTTPATPRIAVIQNWDGETLPNGTSLALSPIAAGTTDSLRFRIKNTGTTSLTLNAATNLVSGSCFSLMETPRTEVAAGDSAYFRVRIQCSTPGTFIGTVTIASNDPATPTYRFTVTGPVLPAHAGDLVVLRPVEAPATRFWNAARAPVTFRPLRALPA